MPFPAYQNDYVIWASGGVSEEPPVAKIETGWERERPPFEYQNWWQERVDNLLFEFNRGYSRGMNAIAPDNGAGSVTSEFRRAVIASDTCWLNNQNGGAIIASRGLLTNSAYCLSMGYGTSLSAANLTVELDAQTGDAFFAGDVDATGVTTEDLIITGEASFSGSNFSISGEVNFESSSFLNVVGSVTFSSGFVVEDDISFAGLGSPGIASDLDVYGDVTADAFFVGVDEVYHPGNVSSTIENFMDANTQSAARSAIGVLDPDDSAQFYTGSSQGLTDYPVGSILMVVNESGSPPTRNSTFTIYLNDNATEFSSSLANSSGTSLSGTWKCRGGYGGNNGLDFFLAQRIS